MVHRLANVVLLLNELTGKNTMKRYYEKKAPQYIAALLFCLICSTVTAQEIAFAFDKALSRSTSLDGMARAKMLVRNLAVVDVKQSLFLIRTKDITANTVERLMFYDNAGQLLANAGANYSLLSRNDVYRYQVDILKANAMLSQYINYHQHIYFPYLYEGGDTQILSQLHTFLAEHGYQPAYTSYQAYDDYMDQLYQARVMAGKYVDINRVEKAYVKMLVDEISNYNNKAQAMLGYSPRQIILLHENDLAAYCIIGLVDALNAKGFKIIAPEKILADPIGNPFFAGGYSSVGYMQSITGFTEPRRENLHVLSAIEKQKVHGYLLEQGLTDLLPL